MTTLKKRSNFLESEEAEQIREKLRYMAANSAYNTVSMYSSNSADYPDNQMPFIDKHMNYLNAHPNLDAQMYIANLQLMTRVRK